MDTPKRESTRDGSPRWRKGRGVSGGKFSEEYKAETVRLIQTSGKSIREMALELGIGETAVRRWVAQAEVEAGRGPARAWKQSEREG